MARGRPPGVLNKNTLVKMAMAAQTTYADLPDDVNTGETDAQILNRIRKTFSVLDRMIEKIINEKIRGCLISGAPGSGKTHSVETALLDAEQQGFIKLVTLKGATSAIGLYQSMYEAMDPKSVLLLDDCDNIWGDEQSLNLMKAALDTNNRRWISWNKESSALKKNGIPTSFRFDGTVIFITNKDILGESEKDNKMSVHYRALLSRVLMIDLGIHTKREIMIRVEQLIRESYFLEDNGLTEIQGAIIIDWLKKNKDHLHSLSMRTAYHLGKAMLQDEDWDLLAKVTLFKQSSKRFIT